jgi:acyl carrier protein
VSIFSGRFADQTAERDVIKSYLLHRQQQNGAALDAEQIDEMLRERLKVERVVCRLRSISEIIAEHAIEWIDLLKVDVEKSELDLLAGIEESDWPRIRQIVMEVHDVDGRLGGIVTMLESKGYEVTVKQEQWFEQTSNHNLYAVRHGHERRPWRERRSGIRPVDLVPKPEQGSDLEARLRAFVRETLPDYMVPATFVFMDRYPVTASGKVNRAALPDPGEARRARRFTAPRPDVEKKIAGMFAELLGVTRVGLDDSFFDLGGHSLLATQLISRLRDALNVTLPVRAVFDTPTVGGLAMAVEAATVKSHDSDAALRRLDRASRRSRRSSL